MSRVKNLIVIGGVAMIAIVFALIFFVPRTLAIGQGGPSSQTEADTQVCPLSDKQREEGPKKFAEMMPTFTNPRCINCHGAVNPFAANTNHVGGRIGQKFKEITRHDDILGKDVKIVIADVEDPDTLFTGCQDCHSALPGWRLPPPQLWFVGKSPVQLCKQMRREFGVSESFINHLANDSFGFIQEAFRGTRGLDDNGQAAYENETGKDFKPEPPPITNAQFVNQGKAWVEALGGEFKGGLSCGCEPLHYAVVINRMETLEFLAGGGHAHLERSGTAELPITFSDDGSFVGQATVTVAITETVTVPEGSCQGTGKDSIPVRVSGNVDDQNRTMHLKTSWNTPITNVSGVCQAGGQSVAWSNTTRGSSSAEVNSALTHGVDLPAFVDVSRVFSFPVPDGTSTITLTIKKIE